MPDDNQDTLAAHKITLPPGLRLSAHGFVDAEYAKKYLNTLLPTLREISKAIDLSTIDGVTVSCDFDTALSELDRGYETDYVLKPTKEGAIGVAMTVSVKRDGNLKTHIVFNAYHVIDLMEGLQDETQLFSEAFHTIAHECAHVEVNAKFDKCFPNWLLNKPYDNILDSLRWPIILLAWNEYAVCKITGSIGRDPTKDYLEILLTNLGHTRAECFKLIEASRTQADTDQVILDVYKLASNLIKYTGYYLGAVHRLSPNSTKPDELRTAKEFEWFEPFFDKIEIILISIFDEYGKWEDHHQFEKIGDILEEIVESIGIYAKRMADNNYYFDIPYKN